MMITDTLLPYRGFGNCESSGTIGSADLPLCRLRVYERQGDYPRHTDELMVANGLPPQPAARVIVLTELPENDGTSVTNMMHRLPNAVFDDRALMGFPEHVDALHLPHIQTVVVEHYPPDVEMERQGWEGYVPQNEVLTGRGDDQFAFVDFDLIEWDSAKSHHAYGKANWRPTTKADVEMLIGEQWG